MSETSEKKNDNNIKVLDKMKNNSFSKESPNNYTHNHKLIAQNFKNQKD